MLVLAHRGVHHDARENTLASFEAALAAGVDGIETDVRLTRDGVPVLFHDASVRRRRVAAMTRSQLAHSIGNHVTTLAEAIERFDVLWDVEIKAPDAVDATVEVLKRFEKKRRLVVTSFQPLILQRVMRQMHVEVGRIFSRRPLRGRRRPGRFIVIQMRLATPFRIKRLHAEHRKVYVYGARTLADHAKCASLGVEAVITDWPDRVRR
jgi:glycerophosphoryl diester phosphodiesterase